MASDSDPLSSTLAEPRMEDRKTLLVAGLMKEYTMETVGEISALWQKFVPHIGHIPGQVGRVAYGVIYNLKTTGGFAYLAGMEVASASEIPDELNVVRIPDLTYAVFPHHGHVSTMKDTIASIWNEWLPASGLKLTRTDEEMPDLIEYYGEGFNPATGTGDIEIWIPIKNRTRRITIESSAPETPENAG